MGTSRESPDIWLTNGNPWEIPRPETTYRIGFYGKVDNFKWTPSEEVSFTALYPGFSNHPAIDQQAKLHAHQQPASA